MLWMNIDKVFRTCVIHRDECPWVRWVMNNKPQFKGINEMKRDGGWFSFSSLREAESRWRDEWESKEYVISMDGCHCYGRL